MALVTGLFGPVKTGIIGTQLLMIELDQINHQDVLGVLLKFLKENLI